MELDADEVEKWLRWGRRRRNIAGGGGAFVWPAKDKEEDTRTPSTKSGVRVRAR